MGNRAEDICLVTRGNHRERLKRLHEVRDDPRHIGHHGVGDVGQSKRADDAPHRCGRDVASASAGGLFNWAIAAAAAGEGRVRPKDHRRMRASSAETIAVPIGEKSG